MKLTKQLLVMISLLTLFTSNVQATPFNPQVDRARRFVMAQTTQGQVAGFHAENGLDIFLGIPYAEPPIGRLRFAPPQPVAKWEYVRPAYLFGPSCPQLQDKSEPSSMLYQDEDCLSLNIWTPGVDSKKRPVMVYIHGGGFVEGGSGDPLYNGARLAKRGDIVVTSVNYRVAALGGLALDSYGQEFAGSGNLNLQDQIAGLTWIKNNIAQFGGDPDNITIMGESAGGASVMFLMISPKAKGLFQKAIAESGTTTFSRTKEQAAKYTKRFMELAGVKNVDGLRKLSLSKILELEMKLMEKDPYEADWIFAPVMDDIIVPANPFRAFEEGAAAKIPLLNGTTYDEYRYWQSFFPSLKDVPTKKLLSSAPDIWGKLGSKLDTISDYYRKKLPGSGYGGVNFALATDIIFKIPHIQISDL